MVPCAGIKCGVQNARVGFVRDTLCDVRVSLSPDNDPVDTEAACAERCIAELNAATPPAVCLYQSDPNERACVLASGDLCVPTLQPFADTVVWAVCPVVAVH